MILHLERKFTAPTETFIANQINLNHFKNSVFAIKNLKNLTINAKVYEAPDASFLSSRILTSKQKRFFKEKFEKLQPSLIHAHFLTDAAFFNSFTKKINVPRVCSAYGYDVSSFPQKFGGIGRRYLIPVFKNYDLILAMSKDMANDIAALGCDQKKIKIHYHGIDTHFFDFEKSYADKDFFTILTLASLRPKKGHMTVLKALALLKELNSILGMRYIIVGNGPLMESLQKFVAEQNLSSYVEFRGSVKHSTPEFKELFEQADVFVHPSVTSSNGDKEGIPGTIVEAMAAGLPVIATYHAGIPEIIDTNINGLLIKEHDAEAMANYLVYLQKSESIRKQLGTAAKKKAAEKLDARVKILDLENIYKAIQV